MEENLVIDDEPMIRSMMKMSLAEMGYTVTGAHSVEEALGIYENGTCRFSAMVTDFNLEDGNGLDNVNTVNDNEESIGSGGACYLASLNSPVEKVVLVVPFEVLSSVAKEKFPSVIVNLVLKSNWNNVNSLSEYKGPVDIFGAKLDTIIPVSHEQAIVQSVPNSELTLIEGGHNDWSRGDRVTFRNP